MKEVGGSGGTKASIARKVKSVDGDIQRGACRVHAADDDDDVDGGDVEREIRGSIGTARGSTLVLFIRRSDRRKKRRRSGFLYPAPLRGDHYAGQELALVG